MGGKLTEVELVMGGVVAVALLGTAFFLLSKSTASSSTTPAQPATLPPTPGTTDVEPPFVPGT
jgi:hypothetical protein